MKNLPLYYYPVSVCIVDDCEIFSQVVNNLINDSYQSINFQQPKEAYEFLNSYRSPLAHVNFMRESIENDTYGTIAHLPIDINISEIVQLQSSSLRENELAVLVIDNHMPNMTGLEICKKLGITPYKKILLTAQMNPYEVVEAFNKEIIDKFISKDKDLASNLKKIIDELAYEYFYDKSKNILRNIEASNPSPMSDPIFIEFYFALLKKHNIQEFYLIDKNGSFLLIDNENKSNYFILMDDKAMQNFVKVNDEASGKAKELIDKAAEGKLIPFFGMGKESWDICYDEWDKYFYPSESLNGREKYFWTLIKN